MRKTSITLAALSLLFKKKLVKKVLVVAPRRVCHLVWPAEVKKWKEFSHLRVSIIHGRNKADALAEDADIYVTTFETLSWLLKAELTTHTKRGKEMEAEGRDVPLKKKKLKIDKRWFKSLGFDLLVVDELSKFKNKDSLRSRLIGEILPLFKRRWGLTGSPATNGLMGLFGQMYVLDLGETLGTFITHYRRQYFDPTGFQPNRFTSSGWKLKEGAEETIFRAIEPRVFYEDDETLLDMPDLFPNPIWVELPESARKVYDQMEEEFFLEMDAKVVRAANAGVKSNKLRQLANGAVYFTEYDEQGLKKVGRRSKEDWLLLHDAKLEALEDLLEELQGSPLLVAYDFGHDLQRLQKKFGKDIPVIGGGTSDKRTAMIEKAWNKGEIEMLLGHPASMGHGLNFQESSGDVAWFSMFFDYELYDQFVSRVRRSGNTRTRVTSHLIAARRTVDVVAMRALERKGLGQQALFDALLAYRLERQPGKARRAAVATPSGPAKGARPTRQPARTRR